MQSTGKQLFLNITLDSPEGKHAEVATDAVESLWIIESVDQLVPVCTMIYQEAYSEFSELFPLLGNETFTVDLGLSRDKYRVFKFKYSSYMTKSVGALLSRNKTIQTNWVDSDFTKLREYPKSFDYAQCTISDVAKKIAAGLPIDIDASKGTADHFLNNEVTGEALKRLASQAYSADGSTFLFFKNNNKYKFVSRNTIMRQSTKASYVYGYNLTHYTIVGNNRSMFTNPVSDIIGYSYEKGENFGFSKTVKDVKSKKASFGKNAPFGDGTDISPRFSYGGMRQTHTAEGRSVEASESFMDSAMRMEFVALGEPFLSCGDVIEVSMGSSFPSMGKQNMLISGKWFVEKIVHYVSKLNYSVKIVAAKSNTDFSRRKAVL